MNNSLTINDLCSKLKNVKRNGNQFSALCPCHDDHKNSLSFTENNGNLLLNCFAGCSLDEICSALGIQKRDLFKSNTKDDGKWQIQKIYEYKDEVGNLLFRMIRYRGKEFKAQKFLNGKWVNGLEGVRRVLYKLPKLMAAKQNTENEIPLVFICEGEKDVETLDKHDLLATCNPLGASNWRDEYSESLNGFNCVILPDNDEPGKKHAMTVARSLYGLAANVQLIELPGLSEKGDVSDWLEAGNSVDQLMEFIKNTRPFEPEKPTVSATENGLENKSNESKGKAREKQTDVLKNIIEGLSLFHTAHRDCYAVVEFDDHSEIVKIGTKEFRSWLSHQHWIKEGKMPSSQALTDTIENLRGRALFNSSREETHIRVAEFEDQIYIDLGNKLWEAVKVSKEGWEIIASKQVPVKFRRSRGMISLPIPERGGTLDNLRNFVNVSEIDYVLLLAWIVNCFRANRPFPILSLYGEHGSAKSTTSEMVRSLIDPSNAPLRTNPKTERDLAISAKNSWIIALDNLSGISASFSDSLCRLATGGGLATRELYADDDEVLFNAKRPIMINGIDELATRPDLLDRCLVLSCPTITENERKTRDDLEREFEVEKSMIFGAILDKLSEGLKNLPNLKIENLPRMADFAMLSTAAFGQEFLDRYKEMRRESSEAAIESSPIGEQIQILMKSCRRYEGTATELLKAVKNMSNEEQRSSKYFPRHPNMFTSALNRIVPDLRTKGILVERGVGRNRRKFILINENFGSAPSSPSTQNNKDQTSEVTMDDNKFVTEASSDERCRGTLPFDELDFVSNEQSDIGTEEINHYQSGNNGDDGYDVFEVENYNEDEFSANGNDDDIPF